MGKSKRGEREYSKEQKLVHENRQLKREVNRLRKQLARIDITAMDEREHDETAEAQEKTEKLSKTQALRQKWQCHEVGCGGFLELILYAKINDTWYYRSCTVCKKRTKSQRYTPEVNGILKNGNKT